MEKQFDEDLPEKEISQWDVIEDGEVIRLSSGERAYWRYDRRPGSTETVLIKIEEVEISDQARQGITEILENPDKKAVSPDYGIPAERFFRQAESGDESD